MLSLSTKERKAKLAKLRITIKEFNDELEKLDAIRQQQVIGIDEMCVKIEKFKELIEYLTILQAKKYNGEETVAKMRSRLKAELKHKQDLIMQNKFETGEIFRTCII